MSMEMDPEYARFANKAVSAARRKAGEASPWNFAQLYLEPLFGQAPSPMHQELFEILAPFHESRGSRLAVAAPRGHAKSTIATLAYVLWCLVYEKEPLIVLASATADQASKLLDHAKRQLETNPLIKSDFPEVVPNGRVRPWNKNGILLGNGAMLVSYASGQNPRGVRNGKHRPTLIIGDDLENKQMVASEAQRTKLSDWFHGTLLKAGTPDTNAIVVGNLFHPESLLATLMDPAKCPGWTTKLYKAVIEESPRYDLWNQWTEIMRSQCKHEGLTGVKGADLFYEEHAIAMNKGAVVLWPEMYPYHKLMKIRLEGGEAVFRSEYQNEPMDPEQCLFAAAPFVYWDEKGETLEQLVIKHGGGRFICACDPSIGETQDGDFCAVVVIFRPYRSHKKYVVAADITRRTPSSTVQFLRQLCEMFDLNEIVVESNGFQNEMTENLKRNIKLNHYNVPVKRVINSGNKIARISGLEAEISQGNLIFSRRCPVLMSQLRHFPCDKHDDGPDALQMCVEAANAYRGPVKFIWT